MKIVFNGESREVVPGSTIADLLNQNGLVPKYVAVEVNLAVVPREEHAFRQLHDGDSVEIVTLVGGG